MKIVLVNPATSHDQIYGDWDLSAMDTYCPPLGLLGLASYVRQLGYAPVVLDQEPSRWTNDELVRTILSEDPDVVGITARTINIFNAARIAEHLKRDNPSIPVVLGGSHFTAEPVRTLQLFRAFDYGAYGEGEVTLAELLERIPGSRDVAGIRGLVWRDEGGTPVVNPPRALLSDLDQLPFPAWDLLAGFPERYPHSALESKRSAAASLITSRGCPYHCTFCDRAIFGACVRHHDAEYTLEMMRHLRSRYGIRDLMIIDDNFALDKRRLFQICETMIAEKMDYTWYCQGHVKFATDDRLRMMRAAGCWFLELGLESGCDRVLREIKKGATKADAALAVRRARAAGLKVKGNFIFGLPGENGESLEETTQFALSVPLTHFQQNFLTIWPGCELSKSADKYGVYETDWSRLAHQRVTFIPHGLTEEDLTRASKSAFRRFYLRPRIMLGFALSATSLRRLRMLWLGVVTFSKTILRKHTSPLSAHSAKSTS